MKKMDVIDLMFAAKANGCTTVKITNDALIPGTEVQELIYFNTIDAALSVDNPAYLLLSYLNYESWHVDAGITLVINCNLRKVGE